MPTVKKTYILLSGYIACGFIGLSVMTMRYHRTFSYAELIVFTSFFAILGISGLVIAYNLRKRRSAERDLEKSERSFSFLVQHVKDYAIFMLDREGKVVTWNHGAEQIKQYKAHEIIGRPMSVFYTSEDIEKGEPEDSLQKAAREGSYESIGLRKRKDGSEFYADVVLTCMRDDKGEITGYVKITKDITAQIRAEEEMKLSLQREKELNEMKSRFVTLASHEFKTPLSVILSSTSLIARYVLTTEQDQRMRHIQRIKSNVKNLRNILNDFLSLEKLEEGVIRNNPVETDALDLAREVMTDIEQSCKQGQKITQHTEGQPLPVMVDELLLRNVLNNLLSNAVKYSPEHSDVQFTLQYLTGEIRYTVADSGIGIPAEEQPHLFERFFRASNTGGIGGTGLGLSIVKRYLDLMGGRIEVRSQPGQGATFIISIPSPPAPEHLPLPERNQSAG